MDKATLDLVLKNQNAEAVKLADYLGKFLVLYFYPKDDTPGCTTEACSFRDTYSEIQELGVKVIGVSKDKPTQHQKFIAKYKLNFELWSDEATLLNQAFGVWQEKKFMGRTYMGTVRTTFIIDPSGKIAKRFDNVKPEAHASEVLAELKKLLAKEKA